LYIVYFYAHAATIVVQSKFPIFLLLRNQLTLKNCL